VERDPLRAGLVPRAEAWAWSSLACREQKLAKGRELLDDWPVERPARWRRLVNAPQSEEELDALRRCGRRGQPYGTAAWTSVTAVRLGVESSLRSVGRPKRVRDGDGA
jgi:putative transposase